MTTKRNLKEIRVYLSPEDLSLIDAQAATANTSRSELIRSRALAPTPLESTRNKHLYVRCVESAARSLPGLPRTSLEAAVAQIITLIHFNQ